MLSIIFYVAGVMIVLAALLYVAPRKFSDPRFRRTLAFFVFRFRADRYWWGLVQLLRALLLSIPSVLFPNQGWYQVGIPGDTAIKAGATTAIAICANRLQLTLCVCQSVEFSLWGRWNSACRC